MESDVRSACITAGVNTNRTCGDRRRVCGDKPHRSLGRMLGKSLGSSVNRLSYQPSPTPANVPVLGIPAPVALSDIIHLRRDYCLTGFSPAMPRAAPGGLRRMALTGRPLEDLEVGFLDNSRKNPCFPFSALCHSQDHAPSYGHCLGSVCATRVVIPPLRSLLSVPLRAAVSCVTHPGRRRGL